MSVHCCRRTRKYLVEVKYYRGKHAELVCDGALSSPLNFSLYSLEYIQRVFFPYFYRFYFSLCTIGVDRRRANLISAAILLKLQRKNQADGLKQFFSLVRV